MLKETFYLDGVDARSVGIHLQNPIEFSEAIPVVKSQEIPGRNGNLQIYTGSYKNRSGEAECFCLHKDVEKALSSASRFLMGKKGYRRLETSDDPEHYWMARVENSPRIEQRLKTLAPFEIGFDCKPQRFVKSGENAIVFTEAGALFNQYGHTALPLIKVFGMGAGKIVVGDCVVDILESNGVLYLDSDTQNAYNVNGNQNLNIKAPTFPVLLDGETEVRWEGSVTRVDIIPRWWEL